MEVLSNVCLEDKMDHNAYISDDDDVSIEPDDHHSNKRQKMTDEERLSRCRERNRVHAKNTRERKRCQMDGLQTRIQELVDEKKRLKSTASESSVATILMSLAGFDQPVPQIDEDSTLLRDLEDSETEDRSNPLVFFKVEGDDYITKSIEKLKTDYLKSVQVSLEGESPKVSLDADPLLAKDKSTCSTLELEMIRRERNRMHAKKTRLRKKKMIQDMETIISSLEKEVIGLQGGTFGLTVLPGTEHTKQSPLPPLSTLEGTNSSFPDQACSSSTTISDNFSKKKLKLASLSHPDQLSRAVSLSSETPSSSASSSNPSPKKRKQRVPNSLKNIKAENAWPYGTETGPKSKVSKKEIKEENTKYLWQQHLSKNATRTISLGSNGSTGSGSTSFCSDSLGSSSVKGSEESNEGSEEGSEEGDSAVSSLLHIGRDFNRPFMCDDLDTPLIRQAAKESEGKTHALEKVAGPFTVTPTLTNIQAILVACESRTSFPQPGPPRNPYWRFPDRNTNNSTSSATLPPSANSELEGAASLIASVSSVYPINSMKSDLSPFKGYLPVKSVKDPSAPDYTQDSESNGNWPKIYPTLLKHSSFSQGVPPELDPTEQPLSLQGRPCSVFLPQGMILDPTVGGYDSFQESQRTLKSSDPEGTNVSPTYNLFNCYGDDISAHTQSPLKVIKETLPYTTFNYPPLTLINSEVMPPSL